MENAIAVTQWFIQERSRIRATDCMSMMDAGEREKYLAWLSSKSETTIRDFQRQFHLPTSENAERKLNVLAWGGYGNWQTIPPGRSGGPPSRLFVSAVTEPR